MKKYFATFLIALSPIFFPVSAHAVIINFDGTESGTSTEYRVVQRGTVVTSPVYSGNYAMNASSTATNLGVNFSVGGGGGSGTINQSIGGTSTSNVARFLYTVKPNANSEEMEVVTPNPNPDNKGICSLRMNSTGTLSLYGSSTILIATGSTVLAPSTWYAIGDECEMGINAAYKVTINGATEMSGNATFASSTQTIANIIYGKDFNENSQNVNFYYDDEIVTNDLTIPNSDSVGYMTPAGNGTTQGWNVGTSPSDWTQVDEIPPDAFATFVSTSSVNAVAEFTMSSPPNLGTITAMKTLIFGAASSTGITILSGVNSGGTVSQTTAMSTLPATSFIPQINVFLTDPHTSAPWTLTGLSNAQLHFTRTGTAGTLMDVTAGGFNVLYTPSTAPAAIFTPFTVFSGAMFRVMQGANFIVN